MRASEDRGSVASEAENEGGRKPHAAGTDAYRIAPRSPRGEPQPSMHVVLTVVSGPRTGVKLRLRDKTAITIGRSKTTDFHVLDGSMSRVHTVVAFDGEGWYVEDQKSRNGTWLDGRRVERETIKSGDVFLLGKETAVRFELEDAADDQRVSSASYGVIPTCSQCGQQVESPAELVRTPDGRPFHLGCRNLDHLIGTELGEFKITEVLPSLGEGFFFRAHQPSLNRNVMLEIFDHPLTSLPGYRQQLLDQVRSGSRFLHPNILQIFAFDEARGMAFVVMEFFAGERLSAVLEQRRFVRIRGAVQVATQLLEALRYAREQGGDKPSITTDFVLVSPEHEVKVKLFEDPKVGARRPLTAREASYIAPEVLNESSEGSDRTLVYSVGAILYHMLAGIPPFEGDSAVEVARRAQSESPPALRRINLKVSPALATVVEQAIDRDPARRPALLEDFLARLKSI
jgi:pSer/pThr/pTyr-binding forkhead associated (FHA) protein